MSSRRVLFTCACLGLLTFGIVLTTLGSVLPAIISRFGIDKAQAGSLFLILTLGILAASLVFGPLVDRYGYKGILLTATALIAVGLEGIAFASSMTILRASIVAIGFGGGIINGSTNALVADISAEGRGASLNLLGVFFGVGAMGVPFLLGALTDVYTQSTLLAAIGTLVAVPFVVIALTGFPAPKHAQGFPIAAAGRLVTDRVLLLMGFMLFLESGMEITVGGWTSTFVTEELAVTGRLALIILSLYWTGMMLARVALGYVLRTASAFTVLYISLVLSLAGSVVLLTTHSAAVAALGVFVLGAGFAAMFPTVLGFVGDRYAALSGTAFSVAIAMALTGGMILPYVAGLLGKRFDMRASFAIVPIALVMLALLLTLLTRILRKRPVNDP